MHKTKKKNASLYGNWGLSNISKTCAKLISVEPVRSRNRYYCSSPSKVSSKLVLNVIWLLSKKFTELKVKNFEIRKS